jgi:hypothetical protein
MSRHLRESVPWQEALRGAGIGRGAAVFGAMRLAPSSESRQVAANLFVAFALAGTSRSPTRLPSMKIRSHSESHLVELDDGSKWQIFPGDLDVTLSWKPDTELKLVRIDDPVSSHALVSGDDNGTVRVLPVGEKWPVDQVRTVLKDE